MGTRLVVFSCGLLLAVAFPGAGALAGTTGTLVGRIVDQDGAAVAAATVSVVSPTQATSTKTDTDGSFRFLTLVPDTYTLSVEKNGFDPISQSGITVQADQTQTLPLTVHKTLRTIGRVSARAGSDLIKPGTVSDVYSVNAAGQEAAAGLGGPGGLNSAYSAIISVPGTVVQQGQQGWYQTVNIRGGDIDQVGYEFDGIPVNRVYDNAPQTMLSILGQQELQVYTGGTPATADATGISGYINQVIRTGTYPGFVTVDGGLGGPSFYHKLSFEIGGATPNRLFSYYVGLAGANQDYRYIDQFNGASDPQFFYPVFFPEGRFNIYDGTPGTINLSGGQTYALAETDDRENVVNLHFGVPHHGGSLRDDVQLLYLTSRILGWYYSSINDQGGPANVANAVGGAGNGSWHDGYVYTGALFAPPDPSKVVPYYFMSSPQNRPFEAPLSDNARDYTDNGVSIAKIQYQRNFDSRSYLRLYGYTTYSNWFIGGPANQQFTGYYGAELNDYELPSHTYGFNLSYANQLSDKHLLTATAAYTSTRLERRFSYGFPGNSVGAPFTNLVDAQGFCYSPSTDVQTSCFNGGARGTFPGSPPPIPSGYTLPTGTVNVIGPSGPTTATWLVTDNGFISSRFNHVDPVFTATSLTDQWHPSERLSINAGIRVENYYNRLGDTTGSDARNFWFNAYDNEHCYKPGAPAPVSVPIGGGITGASPSVCQALFGPGFVPANLVNAQGTSVSNTEFEPRLGFTYTLTPDSVIRGSYGIYTRAVNTSWLQYDAVNQDLASFIGGNFLTLGYNTPIHQLQPDTSYNADLSLEQHLRGTDVSFKVTPFYRSTRNQLQPVPIGVGGVVSGFNVGQQTSTGVELAIRKGDFARDGFAAQLAYTYTHSRIKYNNFPSGTNVIDGLNLYIQEYNSYTSACATITQANSALCGLSPGASNPNAQATFASSTPGVLTPNPYYNSPAQPLLDRNGSYTTYDQIPQPFTGENGYETPHVLSLILNYKHQRLAFTPSLTFSSGAYYGSPLSYPGYVPTGCSPAPGQTGTIQNPTPYTCTGSSAVSGLPFLMIPDAFTGKFDNLGAFAEPSRLTLNFATSWEASPHVKLRATLTGLVDTCFQRGYAWDDPNICVYSQLPSGGAGLGPSGNFIPIGSTPVPFRYPYGPFNNNLNTGFVGTKIPFQAAFDVQVKI